MRNGSLSILIHIDWVVILAIFGLIGVGLASLYSSSLAKEDFLNFEKQIIFFVIGIFLLAGFALIDYRVFQSNRSILLAGYIFSLILLLGVFLFAPKIRGTKTWYDLGIIAIDPSEIAKIVLILLLAKFFSVRHIELYNSLHIAVSGVYVLLPTVLILLQPNIGSALILILIWLGIILISGIRLKQFLFLILIFIVAIILGWKFILQDYQKERIISFFEPYQDPLGTDWQRLQARIAIGSGGLLGKGIGRGPQTQHGFLPEAETDFIFAAIAEEMGFLGVLIVIGLFSIIFWRILRLAIFCPNNFSRFFVVGLAISLISQTIVNIGMNLGLLPIVGISLPFVSYGGSNLIINLISIGIVQSIFVRSSKLQRIDIDRV